MSPLDDASLGAALSVVAAAAEAPDRAFVVESARTWTFAELAAAVRSRPSDESPKVLAAAPSLDAIVSMLEAFERRAPLVPLHPRWSAYERERARLAATTSGRLDRSHLAVLFTSGTSGTPKGALLSRRAFVSAAHASAARLGWRDDDRWLLAMPLAHVGGLSVLVRVLVARRTLVLSAPGSFDPATFLSLTTRHRVTLASLVPTQLAQLVAQGAPSPPSLRAVLLGGAACPSPVLERAVALGYPIHTTYGLTEMCAQVATSRAPVRSADEGVGEPLEGVELAVRDGRIHVRSAHRMDGWLDPELPVPFDPDGFYDTSDLGALDAHGRLHVHARREDLIVTGGENVYPAEVERALLAVEGIRAACVVGVPDELWGQRVAAAVVAEPSLDDATILERLRTRLASFKLPRVVLRLEQLPENAAGKTDRARVRAMVSELAPSRGVP